MKINIGDILAFQLYRSGSFNEGVDNPLLSPHLLTQVPKRVCKGCELLVNMVGNVKVPDDHFKDVLYASCCKKKVTSYLTQNLSVLVHREINQLEDRYVAKKSGFLCDLLKTYYFAYDRYAAHRYDKLLKRRDEFEDLMHYFYSQSVVTFDLDHFCSVYKASADSFSQNSCYVRFNGKSLEYIIDQKKGFEDYSVPLIELLKEVLDK